MFSFRRHPGLVRAVSLLLLGVYFVATFGILPSPEDIAKWIGRHAGERYPCENCTCGCSSAEECWTHCCCHSARERLAWAIEQGVMPPPIVAFSDEEWLAAYNTVLPGSAESVACVARIKSDLQRGVATARSRQPDVCGCEGMRASPTPQATCCAKAVTEPAEQKERRDTSSRASDQSCCETATAATRTVERATPRSTSEAGDKNRNSHSPGLSALACKSLTQLYLITLPPAPPARVVEFLLPEPAPFVRITRAIAIHPSRTLDVPKPPPRSIRKSA